MNFEIRRAAFRDLTALLALEASFPGDRLSRRGFRHLLRRANGDVWVAVDRDGLLGNAVVLYRRNAKSARLYSLVVAAAARGRGIARALLETAELAAAARRAQRLYLEVRCDNDAAIRLYQKLGYRLLGRLPRFYEDGQDALRFERRLDANGPQKPTATSGSARRAMTRAESRL